jgi:hypothetical protein
MARWCVRLTTEVTDAFECRIEVEAANAEAAEEAALAQAAASRLHWHIAHAGEYGPAEMADVEPLDGEGA